MPFATVPAPPPTRKNQRTTSCPAPISANVPYQRGSRLIFSAFECVSIVSSFTSQQTEPVFRALNVQIVHQSPQSKARCDPDEKLSLRIIKGKVRFALRDDYVVFNFSLRSGGRDSERTNEEDQQN